MSILNKVDADATTKTGLEKNAIFLRFDRRVSLPPREFFIVKEFFKHMSSEGIKIYFDGELVKLIFAMMANEVFYQDNPLTLTKYTLVNPANDSQIQNDLVDVPVIPIREFIPMLKSTLEDHVNGPKILETEDGNTNLFHVSLSDLGVDSTVVFRIRPNHNDADFLIKAVSLNFGHPRTQGCAFFTCI